MAIPQDLRIHSARPVMNSEEIQRVLGLQAQIDPIEKRINESNLSLKKISLSIGSAEGKKKQLGSRVANLTRSIERLKKYQSFSGLKRVGFAALAGIGSLLAVAGIAAIIATIILFPHIYCTEVSGFLWGAVIVGVGLLSFAAFKAGKTVVELCAPETLEEKAQKKKPEVELLYAEAIKNLARLNKNYLEQTEKRKTLFDQKDRLLRELEE